MSCLSNNLPLPLTSFIGRERELAAVSRLLPTSRLLTLTGAGGCGKTRLALQVAQTIADYGLRIADCKHDSATPPLHNLQSSIVNHQFPDGIWLVELAPLSDPVLVQQAVAGALGVREAAGQPLSELLLNYLRSRSLLLVLDNCEHLIPACAQLAETLLRACPNVRILATSREAFGIAGESNWLVPPLALPSPEHQPHADEVTSAALRQYDAIRLFAERAAAAQPGFALTVQNQAAVVQICRRLDGIPLALELAAARVKVLAVEQLATRLDDCFHLLTAGSRTALPRHQTLRAAIDWSYDLLAEQEQVLFRRLSIFAGSFTLEAVEAICPVRNAECGVTSENPAFRTPHSVLDLLAHLVDKSLVVVEAAQHGVVRYRLLELIRQFAWEKLAAAGEVEAMHARHLAFFVRFAEEADPRLRGPDQLTWLQRLVTDYDNLRAALSWSLREEDKANLPNRELGLRLAGILHWFWHIRTHFSEARRWCDRALALNDASERGPARAQALQGAGVAAQMQGDFAHARSCLEESLATWRELDNQLGIAFTLGWLAWVASVPGDQATARPLAEASLALFREIKDNWGIAFALATLGPVLNKMGDHATARSLLEESVMCYRALGDTYGIADALNELGGVAHSQGDYRTARARMEEVQAVLAGQQLVDDRFFRTSALHGLGVMARQQGDDEAAVALFAQSLSVARDIGNHWFIAHGCQQLGFIALWQNDHQQAMALFRESLGLFRALGRTENVLSLAGCIALAAHQQQWERAARLCGAVEAMRGNLDRPFTPLQEADYARATAPVGPQRNEPSVADAWRQGQALTLEEAITYALSPSSSHHLPMPVTTFIKVESAPVLQLCALGPARVQQGDHLISEWPYAKVRELLFYLLCHPFRTRQQIGLVFWPDASPAQLRNSFGVTLYHLRQALGRTEWILYENDRYAFNRTLPYWFDLEAFDAQLAQARQSQAPATVIAHLEKAVALNQGDFLEDLTTGDWHVARREQVHQHYLEALLTLGELWFSAGNYERAAAAYQQAIARDSYSEAAHHELIRCYARQGERGQALRHYQQLVELMRAELDLPPSVETAALVERLRRGEAA